MFWSQAVNMIMGPNQWQQSLTVSITCNYLLVMHTKQYKSGRIYCLFPCEKEDTNPLLFEKKSNFNFIFMSSDVIVLARNGWKSQTQETVHLSKEISWKNRQTWQTWNFWCRKLFSLKSHVALESSSHANAFYSLWWLQRESV